MENEIINSSFKTFFWLAFFFAASLFKAAWTVPVRMTTKRRSLALTSTVIAVLRHDFHCKLC